MYFSLITPRPGLERTAAHDWLGNAYGEHQWLWRFFPAPEGTERDFLFRRRDVDGLPRFYVVSRRLPESDAMAWQVQSREYEPSPPVGARLSFELRANPVVTRSVNGKGKRHDVVMDEKQRLLRERDLPCWKAWTPGQKSPGGMPDPRPPLYEIVQRTCTDWLQSRAQDHGFSLESAGTIVESYRQHGGKNGQLRFSTVDFQGELVVTDQEKFANALRSGIGRAKAFGCGLLLVRRA